MPHIEPLTQNDKDEIESTLVGLQDVRELIKRSRVAGLDVDTEEKEVDELDGKLRKIKQAFFPNG